MKTGRVIGVDDGYFQRGVHSRAPIVGTVMKGPVIEGFKFGWITVDGSDATDSILKLLGGLEEQLTGIFLYGTMYGGTNVVSLEVIYERTGLPVVAVVDDRPRDELVRRVIESRRGREAVKTYESNPSFRELLTRRGKIFVSSIGADEGSVLKLVEDYQINSKVPEPLRISHLLGRSMKGWI